MWNYIRRTLGGAMFRKHPSTPHSKKTNEVTVTPEGSRVVDPLSIIKSESFTSHLKDVAKLQITVKKPATR
jgi:hypothetical protein